MMTRDEIVTAVDASAATWSKAANACTYLDITVASSIGRRRPARSTTAATRHLPHEHLVQADGRRASATRTCAYDPAALALTSVSASTSSGIIRDADIEVNAVHFNWADLVLHPNLRGDGQSFHDLQNAVTHEMGHLIGLDHTCYLPAGRRRSTTRGNPIPDCATRRPTCSRRRCSRRPSPATSTSATLAPDDQQAVCDIYPASRTIR